MNYIDFFTQMGVNVVVVDEEGVKVFQPEEHQVADEDNSNKEESNELSSL